MMSVLLIGLASAEFPFIVAIVFISMASFVGITAIIFRHLRHVHDTKMRLREQELQAMKPQADLPPIPIQNNLEDKINGLIWAVEQNSKAIEAMQVTDRETETIQERTTSG